MHDSHNPAAAFVCLFVETFKHRLGKIHTVTVFTRKKSTHNHTHTHTQIHTLLVRSLVDAVPCGMDTACPLSCCRRAYASNKDCDCAVPALLRAACVWEFV